MNERLIQFLSAENISQAQFADSINVARAGVSHIVAGRNKPSWDFIINTMNRYPTLNIEWLLTGKGKMYKSGAGAVNEVKSEKAELDTLFDDVSMYSEVEDVQKNETVEPEPFTQNTPVQQPVSKDIPQQTVPQIPTQTIVKKPNVAKIIVFFDDGTFQECK